jgi:hypothetical protein
MIIRQERKLLQPFKEQKPIKNNPQFNNMLSNFDAIT